MREGRIWSGTKSGGEGGKVEAKISGEKETFSAWNPCRSPFLPLTFRSRSPLFKLHNNSGSSSCCIFARLQSCNPRWSRYSEGQVFLASKRHLLFFLFLFPPFPFARRTDPLSVFFSFFSFLFWPCACCVETRKKEQRERERYKERGFLGLFLGTRNTMDRFRERPRGLNVNNGITARLEDYPRWLSPIAQRVTPDKRS